MNGVASCSWANSTTKRFVGAAKVRINVAPRNVCTGGRGQSGGKSKT